MPPSTDPTLRAELPRIANQAIDVGRGFEDALERLLELGVGVSFFRGIMGTDAVTLTCFDREPFKHVEEGQLPSNLLGNACKLWAQKIEEDS